MCSHALMEHRCSADWAGHRCAHTGSHSPGSPVTAQEVPGQHGRPRAFRGTGPSVSRVQCQGEL